MTTAPDPGQGYFALPGSPVGKQATARSQAGGFVIDLPASRLSRTVWTGVSIAIIGGVLSSLVIIAAILSSGSVSISQVLGACISAFFAITIACFLRPLFAGDFLSAKVTVHQDSLRIEVKDLAFRKERVWKKTQILAVGAGKGLWVVADGTRFCFFRNRSPTEQAVIAELVRKALDIPESVPPEEGELPISFRFSGDAQRSPGLMRVKDGEIKIRHGFASRPRFCFRARRGQSLLTLKFVWSERNVPIPVEPIDFTCRIPGDGTSCLQIAPTRSPLSLTIWCDDEAAMPEVLKCFWGLPAKEPSD